MLTVVMPSFYSSKLVEERILEIDKDIPIIIIENSKDIEFKKKIESKHKNVKVIIPKENLGFPKAVNIGIKEAKTEFVFLTQPDLLLVENCINKLVELIKVFKDFSVLTPYDKNDQIWTNYEIYNDKKKEVKKNELTLKEVDYVDLSWLINKTNFSEDDYWDEKIFQYFDADDFAKRLRDKNKKIFVTMEINTFHIGSASHDKKLEFYSKLHRNWHYNWSRFYFNKKHYGSLYAYKKGLPLLIKLVFKFLKKMILFKKKEIKLVIAEIHGLFASMINRSSYYRASKDIELKNL
tara:strand:- start:42 stop:920 length:879 start_codon:yes stop_codon:yes gene_type:complete